MGHITGDPDYPCVVPAEHCNNKQISIWNCHGSLRPECFINWASTDPEDVEPYEEYVAECLAKKASP